MGVDGDYVLWMRVWFWGCVLFVLICGDRVLVFNNVVIRFGLCSEWVGRLAKRQFECC